ncbi:hypothetical protein TSUD_159170 [Trifolium subterraneum]|uniref:Uncharacterized protein n=1 Tax=Trifolium subterraneum TaxID=3900 RepID=A0A2Z6M8F8_TRISU|nr:hypothetical protein TSUD_159170 [Trifolium subterraneum]
MKNEHLLFPSPSPRSFYRPKAVWSVADQAELSLLEGSENLFDAEVAAHRELLRGDHS